MKKQRIITNVIGVVMILSAFLAIILHGWKVKYIDKQEMEGKLTVKNQSVAVGEVVDVTIKLDSNKKLNSVEFYLSYDETMLEFQPEDNKEIVGSSGLLHINEQFLLLILCFFKQLSLYSIEIKNSSLLLIKFGLFLVCYKKHGLFC